MKEKEKRERKISVKIIIIPIIILMTIIAVILVLSNASNLYLENIGYSKLEIKEIEKLTKDEISIIKKYKYNKNIIYIISSDNYNPNKLDLYLKYTNEYKDIDYLKIFEIINNSNFKEENIDNYIKLLGKIDNVDGIIKYANKYGNTDVDNNTISFMLEDYYIEDYLDRYLNYYENHKDLSYKEIVTRINSNLDHKFYTDSKKADLSKGMYTLVNKFNYLDKDFVPDNVEDVPLNYAVNHTKLNKVALENFIKMADDMKKEGLTIKATTAYRDYNFQSILYNNYVKADGVENADRYSARPGYSEHQLGYSTDVTNADKVGFGEFEYTEEYKWLVKNAHKYGFILRYPKDKEYLTGYIFEAWHYRYVGVDVATYIYEHDLIYEEYYEYFLR